MRNSELSLSRENRLALLVLAVVQSLLLLLLHKAITHETWPATDPRWLYSLYTFVIGLPLFLYLAAVDWRDRANVTAAAVLGLLLFWIGWHAGWLASPYFGKNNGGGTILPTLACSVAVALFILAFYFRTQRESQRFDYARLLDHSWRNALTLGFQGLFLLVFWLLLNLWAELFAVIEIDFFDELFDEPEFVYPVFGLVGGWGLGLIRARTGLIATVRNLCEVLIRALLPLVAFILVIFLATLPFTGVTKLWDTGHAAALLLSLAAVLLFFFNAVVADEGELAMNAWLRRLVLLALLLVPVNSVLAGWALWLRVDQYGWTLDRLWALLVEIFIAAFCVGYAVLILKHRGLRVEAVRRWNIILGAALVAALILVNTPLLDFHRIAANNQVAGVLSDETSVDDFDALYVRFELGKYGVDALEKLKTSERAKQDVALKKKIDAALAADNRWAASTFDRVDLEKLRARFIALPGTELDDDFLFMLGSKETDLKACFRGETDCVIGDLERNGKHYRVQLFNRRYVSTSHVWTGKNGEWIPAGDVRRFGCSDVEKPVDLTQPLELLETEFFVFRNGKCLYQLLPDASHLNVQKK